MVAEALGLVLVLAVGLAGGDLVRVMLGSGLVTLHELRSATKATLTPQIVKKGRLRSGVMRPILPRSDQ